MVNEDGTPIGLSEAKMRVMIVIQERGDVTPAYLRWKLGGTATNMSLHLSSLYKYGLINYDHYMKHRFYHLTTTGMDMMTDIKERIKRIDDTRSDKKFQKEMALKYNTILEREKREMSNDHQ